MKHFNKYFQPKLPNALEVKQYTEDLKSMTILRDRAEDNDERERYSLIIEIMQKTLIRIIEQSGE